MRSIKRGDIIGGQAVPYGRGGKMKKLKGLLTRGGMKKLEGLLTYDFYNEDFLVETFTGTISITDWLHSQRDKEVLVEASDHELKIVVKKRG